MVKMISESYIATIVIKLFLCALLQYNQFPNNLWRPSDRPLSVDFRGPSMYAPNVGMHGVCKHIALCTCVLATGQVFMCV